MLEDITGEEIKNQFKSNKKLRLITMIVGAAVVLALGYFVYLQFVWYPANEESKDKYWQGLNLAAADSTDAALDELKPIKDKYDGKIGGEIAQFVYARQLMNKGEFKKAIEDLEGVDVEDTYISIMAIGLRADCYSEMKKYEEAANLYMEAADMADNDLTTPTYLKKAGLCAEELKDFKKAGECYQRIVDDYSEFSRTNQIERYLARANSTKTK
jgi:tetratricopeptide (TPR) repeat protein